jgi:hypothetical protein
VTSREELPEVRLQRRLTERCTGVPTAYAALRLPAAGERQR